MPLSVPSVSLWFFGLHKPYGADGALDGPGVIRLRVALDHLGIDLVGQKVVLVAIRTVAKRGHGPPAVGHRQNVGPEQALAPA